VCINNICQEPPNNTSNSLPKNPTKLRFNEFPNIYNVERYEQEHVCDHSNPCKAGFNCIKNECKEDCQNNQNVCEADENCIKDTMTNIHYCKNNEPKFGHRS
jgi:hypothetical protein